MSEITMTPARMFQYFQQLAGSFGGSIVGDGSGTEMVTDPNNNDTITYDPTVSTADDGIQNALSVDFGDEQLTKYGNGAATVTESNGNTLAIDHGELYGLKAGASQRVDLGAASSPQGWQTALLEGYTNSQGAEDLEKTATLGISAAPSFQQAFGSSGARADTQNPEQQTIQAIQAIIQLLQQLEAEL